MSSDKCKLTGNIGKFVKAHIVPRALYAKGGGVVSYTSDGSRHPKRAPVGLYDCGLVIHETESELLKPLDDYGIKFLRQQVGNWFALDDPPPIDGWLVNKFDFSKVRAFFLSILWRAAASDAVEPPLNLGVRLDALRQVVLEPGAALDDFPVSLIRYRSAQPVVMQPLAREVDGGFGALAIFAGYEILWYIDPPNRTVEPERLLRPQEPWLVLEREWGNSRPQKMLDEIANQSINRL